MARSKRLEVSLNRRQFLGAASVASMSSVGSAGNSGPMPAPAENEEGNWSFTETDADIAARVQSVLPAKLFDIHAHLYRTAYLGAPCPELPAQGPETVDERVWRTHLGKITGEDRLAGALFVPYPVKHGDVEGGNAFVLEQVTRTEQGRGLLVVTPNSDPGRMETYLKNPRMVGFKPYHVFAPCKETFFASLDEYLPEWVWRLADQYRSVILLHLVRSGALSDPGNQETILRRCAAYPNANLLLAHAGRGFHAPNTIEALPALKGVNNIYFDTAAVCEPDTFMAIVKTFGPKRLLWGSDFPVSQQRGKCVTVGDAFSWICPRRIDVDPSAPACHPTLVGLESLRALQLAARLMDWSGNDLEDIFFCNAQRLLGMQSAGQE